MVRLPDRADGPAAKPVAERRQQALLATGRLDEAARELAVRAFAELGVPPEPGARPPAVAVAGGWWRRLVWGRRVRRLWAVAAGDGTSRVSAAGLGRLLAAVHELRAAAAAGLVRLSPAQ